MDVVDRPGLEGVIAVHTRLSSVDGTKGELIVGGYPIEALAENARFEQLVWLLWHDRLPTADEERSLRRQLADARRLPAVTLDVLRAAASAPPMVALRMAVATLDGDGAEGDEALAARIVGGIPAIVASHAQLAAGRPVVDADPSRGVGEDLLRMSGLAATPARVRALETYLATVADHGSNASAFAARVVISTGGGMVDAITAAIGALRGPLHGGAPGPALELVREVGRLDRAEEVIAARLANGGRLMGFGHRVYRVRDPRAEVLSRACAALFAAGEGDPAQYELARGVERVAVAALARHRPARGLQTNVEFYTALLLDALGFPTDRFTPVFAVGRAAGWTAHAFEQRRQGKLIRPLSAYDGPRDRTWPAR